MHAIMKHCNVDTKLFNVFNKDWMRASAVSSYQWTCATAYKLWEK